MNIFSKIFKMMKLMILKCKILNPNIFIIISNYYQNIILKLKSKIIFGNFNNNLFNPIKIT